MAGMVTTTVLHPLDLVKIRLQGVVNARRPSQRRRTSLMLPFVLAVHDGSANAAVPHYRNFLQALRHIVRHEGARSLYQGIQPAIAGSTLAWGTYFYFYTSSKEALAALKLQQSPTAAALGFGDHSLAAAMAATGVCLLTNPFWLLKTRMALEVQKTSAEARPGGIGKTPLQLASAVRQVWGHEGVAGFYRGFGPGWLFFMSHGAVQFGWYEELKEACVRRKEDPTEALTPWEAFGCGLVSKLIAVCSTYPIQLVRSRLQQKGGETEKKHTPRTPRLCGEPGLRTLNGPLHRQARI